MDNEKFDKRHLEQSFGYLLSSEPFYGAISAYIPKYAVDHIPTAAVGFHGDNVAMFYNPDFFLGLTQEQRVGVLKHEMLHLIYEHIFVNKGMLPREVYEAFAIAKLSEEERKNLPRKTVIKTQAAMKLWNVATDLAINSIIPREQLPEKCLIPGEGDFVDMPKDKDALWYWGQLLQDKDLDGEAEQAEQLLQELEEMLSRASDSDDHSQWGQECDDKGNPIEDASDAQKEIAKRKFEETVRYAKEQAEKSNQWGSMSQSLRNRVDELFKSQLSWKRILRSFVSKSIRGSKTSSWRKPHRKLRGLKPGRTKSYTSHLAIAIDMSGSVSDKEIQYFFSELMALTKHTQITVIPFDSIVIKDEIFVWKKDQAPDLHRVATGGTNFQAPTDYVNENRRKFDGLIIFTDMIAPKPGPCRVKRLWVAQKGSPREAAGNEWFAELDLSKEQL